MTASEASPFLVVATTARWCAIPLEFVRETMRPLPIEAVPSAPPGVCGVSLIRGASVPVVDLESLLEERPVTAAFRRLVLLHVEGRHVALGVAHVSGVRRVEPGELTGLPPLLSAAASGVIETFAALDSKLLSVLRSTHLLLEKDSNAIQQGAT